jgi:single-strand DNA-binding protein
LRKGRLAAVEGRIQIRNYENNEGKRVYVTEIIADNVHFLESANNNRRPSEEESDEPRRNNSNRDPFQDDGKPIDISDDDLPF